ncbi:MAG: NHL repeat-containing protein [Desulfuromonadales bacterium]|nr:NHL repeat-containing protein [Desulfuromonadales bacterium]
MRQLLTGIVSLVALGCLLPAAVGAAQLKHLQTLYADGEGVALKLPEGVACDEKTLVVADTGNSRVVIFSLGEQTLVAKAVLPLEGIVPLIVRMNSRGDIYLLNGKDRTVAMLGADGKTAGALKPKGLPDAQNFVPRSFAFDAQDNLYLLDIFAERVLVLDAAGQYLRQIAFPKSYGTMADLAINSQGTVYLLDSVAGAIYAAGPGAEAFTLLGKGLKEYTNFPTSLAIDGQGTIYLSDQHGSGLALIGKDGSFLGRKLAMGWEEGQLYYPAQLCINSQGKLIVADRSNNRVQVFSILNE